MQTRLRRGVENFWLHTEMKYPHKGKTFNENAAGCANIYMWQLGLFCVYRLSYLLCFPLMYLSRTYLARSSSRLAGVWWAVCLFWLFSGVAKSSGAPVDSVRYDVRAWQTDEGLPQNSVNAIAQTQDGFLWVGTREGLARFDGVRFTIVDEPSAPHLRQAWITTLCATRDGSLWIASESNGVTRLQNGVFRHYGKADELAEVQIQCLLESRNGGLWIGGETGLVRFKDGRFTVFSGNDLLRNNSVKALCEEPDGILRVATVTGLVSVNADGVVSANNFGIGTVAGVLKSVCRDRQGRLWLGATDGLMCLADGKWGSYAANKSLPEKIITVIHEDRAGQLWIGSYAGLSRRVDGILSSWWLNKAGVDDLVNTIYEDREQNLWIGGRDGLYRLSPARLVTLTKQDGLNANNVVSVLEDREGAMWFGTWDGGLTRLKNGQFTAITSTNGLTHDRVLSLHESQDGSLYVGMDFLGVLNRLRAGFSNDFPRQSGLLNAAIRVIHESADGALWIGTAKGLNVIRNDQVATFSATNGLAGNGVTAIYEDRKKNLWIGTDGGLSRWTGDGFTNLTVKDGLSRNYVNAIHEDSAADELWVGTKGGGLNRIKAGKITSYTTRQGLFNDDVYEILEDDSGHLWMSCRRGIFRVSRSQFDAFDQGKIGRLSCTTFGREDGLATVQFNGVAKPAGWKSRDGRLWFPSIRGVVAVESRIKLNEQPPLVSVEEVVVDGQALRSGGLMQSESSVLDISPGSGRVEIHYTALSLQAPEKNRFKYQLEGLDEDWVDAGHRRVAYYNNVIPGRYRFRVMASNNDGVWNETGAQLDIHMRPHYWQTWWFRVVIVVMVVVLVAGFYRARVARLRALADLRIRIAQDLHDDVGSRLTRVAMVTELADRETPAGPGKSHIQNIANTVRDITRAMDEIVWTINPRNDSLENLANYTFHYAQEYFQDTGVRCRLDLPHDLPDRRVTTEERHNLFMAVKEALNNVLKHAGATEVRIALTMLDGRMMIIITDNGRGVDKGLSDPTGDGMLNMKQRLETIGGKFDLESNPSGGTTVTMRLPGRWSA